MKYTEEQNKRLKRKGTNGFTKYDRFIPDVKIVNGYYIIESKLNYTL